MEILVPVDDSEASLKAFEAAIDFGSSVKAKIVLIHVIPKIDVSEEFAKYANMEHIENPSAGYLYAEGQRIMGKFRKFIPKDVECEEILKLGNPSDKILQVASDRKVDLIVMGFRGLQGINRVRALGSVSRRVIENAEVPVLVVPEVINSRIPLQVRASRPT